MNIKISLFCDNTKPSVAKVRNTSPEKPLVFRISIPDYPRFKISTRLKCHPDNFSLSDKIGFVTKKQVGYDLINEQLELKRNAVFEAYKNLIAIKGAQITPESIKTEYERIVKQGSANKSDIVYPYIDEFKKANEQTTSGGWTGRISKLGKDLKDCFGNELNIYQLQNGNIEKFVNHLLKNENTNNTILGKIKVLRALIRFINENYPDKQLKEITYNKIKSQKVPVVSFLTQNELKRFERVKPLGELETNVKDRFLFRCYTGVRYSDLDNINAGGLNDSNLTFQIKKGGFKPHTIPLAKKALALLEKYGEFPAVSDTDENDTIKELAKRAKIDQEVTIIRKSGNKEKRLSGPKYDFLKTHSARRTFGRVLFENNKNVFAIQKYYGHSKIETTLQYIGATETDQSNLIAGVFD